MEYNFAVGNPPPSEDTSTRVFEVTAGRLPPIDFAPATLEEEVLQNVRCVLNTMKYSVPLDRDLGLSATYLDAPIEKTKAKMVSDIIMAIAECEPRAAVTEITFEPDIDGILKVKVKVRIDEPE